MAKEKLHQLQRQWNELLRTQGQNQGWCTYHHAATRPEHRSGLQPSETRRVANPGRSTPAGKSTPAGDPGLPWAGIERAFGAEIDRISLRLFPPRPRHLLQLSYL